MSGATERCSSVCRLTSIAAVPRPRTIWNATASAIAARNTGQRLADADDHTTADEARSRRHREAAPREQREAGDETDRDRGVEDTDPDVAGAELAARNGRATSSAPVSPRMRKPIATPRATRLPAR